MSYEARGRCDICYVGDGVPHKPWCEFGEGCEACSDKDTELKRLEGRDWEQMVGEARAVYVSTGNISPVLIINTELDRLRARLSLAEGKLCQAREEWEGLSRHFEIPQDRPAANNLEAWLKGMDAALSSTAPCWTGGYAGDPNIPHPALAADAELTALREERDRLRDERDHYRTLWLTVDAELAALREEVRRLREILNMDYRDLVDESFDIGGWNKLTAEEQWAIRNTFIELRRRAKEG